VCQQNFKKLAPRRNGLAEKLVSEKEQKKAYQEQEEAKWSEGKNLFIFIEKAKCNLRSVSYLCNYTSKTNILNLRIVPTFKFFTELR
jgi:hypothetical protein